MLYLVLVALDSLSDKFKNPFKLEQLELNFTIHIALGQRFRISDDSKMALKVAKSTKLRVTDVIFTERIAFTDGPHESLEAVKTLEKETEEVICVSNYVDEQEKLMHFTLVDADREAKLEIEAEVVKMQNGFNDCFTKKIFPVQSVKVLKVGPSLF